MDVTRFHRLSNNYLYGKVMANTTTYRRITGLSSQVSTVSVLLVSLSAGQTALETEEVHS